MAKLPSAGLDPHSGFCLSLEDSNNLTFLRFTKQEQEGRALNTRATLTMESDANDCQVLEFLLSDNEFRKHCKKLKNPFHCYTKGTLWSLIWVKASSKAD